MNGQELIKNQKVAQIEFLNDEWILYSEGKRDIALDVLIVTVAQILIRSLAPDIFL